ncbi:MAG: IclR family transcriptional regulator [Chloroflexi bacterium]|nr:IclR family transcriptional regulator [Chloroflexota bacterium]
MTNAGEQVDRTPQTIRRAVGFLDLLGTAPQGMSLRQLSESLGLTKSTAHRILSGLVAGGLVEVSPDTRRYRLGLKVVELSAVLLDSMDVREQGKALMQQLGDLSRETIHMGVLDHFEVIFIGHIETPESVRMSVRVGHRAPAHCSSLGKVLLADLDNTELQRFLRDRELPAYTPNTITDPQELLAVLDEVRVLGYAWDEEENRPGIRCLGAPVRDHAGKAVAAISVSGPAFRFTRQRAEEFIRPLLDAAGGISERMGWRGTRRQEAL